MQTTGFCGLDSLGCTGNIAVIGTCQRTHGRVLDDFGNGLDAFKVTIGTGSKPSLDHIDLEALELACNAQLFIAGHGRAGRLFAITQGRVKNDEFVGHVRSFF